MSGATTKPPQNDRLVIREMLLGEGTYATTLLAWFIDTYGMRPLGPTKEEPDGEPWHAETIKLEIEQDWAVQLPNSTFDKLMAAICIVTTDLFFKKVDRFIHLCNVLAGDDFTPGVFDPADAAECAWGISEALILCPPDDDEPEPFCDEIRYYVGFVLRDEGFVTAPDILRIALDANWSDQIQYQFSDDPDMFAAINKGQAEKTEDVKAVIRAGLQELFEQLQALPLKRGTKEKLFNRLSTVQGESR